MNGDKTSNNFSYVDEYIEDYQDFGKEEDFEEIDDNVLDEFDDEIFDDEAVEEDIVVEFDPYSEDGFADEFDVNDSEEDE